MRYFILVLCMLLPFCLAYLMKKTNLGWYSVLIITIMFGLLVASYLIKNNEKNQYSLKSFLFKSKIRK
jgi:hypothetical protein